MQKNFSVFLNKWPAKFKQRSISGNNYRKKCNERQTTSLYVTQRRIQNKEEFTLPSLNEWPTELLTLKISTYVDKRFNIHKPNKRQIGTRQS